MGRHTGPFPDTFPGCISGEARTFSLGSTNIVELSQKVRGRLDPDTIHTNDVVYLRTHPSPIACQTKMKIIWSNSKTNRQAQTTPAVPTNRTLATQWKTRSERKTAAQKSG